ncbi:MAG: hypothetical protein OEY25_08480 [Candidatus Aminicenantes bacterium]|nr:hypothetical protein [Candidatus Aminicenantes bacterium]MDH5705282.1 hypothetical protein [Candidatus Aminicenantes bacterium]
MASNISLEPFRGDIEGLERMALSSWRDEYWIESYPNLYRPDFLRFLFDRIQDKTHLIVAYRGGEIVSFLDLQPGSFHSEDPGCLRSSDMRMIRKVPDVLMP